MRGRLALVAIVFVVVAGCGAGAQSAASASPLTGSISVVAAASLTAAFQVIGGAFQKLHPGAKVQFNFGGSSTLVTQIKEGAPGDLFASADQPTMQKLVDASLLAGSPQVFAKNKLAIVVGAGNPKRIARLADLARAGTVAVFCAPTVPCGNYARLALAKAGVRVAPVSQELDVKAVVSKVALGEADAGIVYVTDVKAGGSKVQGVPIPNSENVIASYPVAILKGTHNTQLARAFLDYVVSSAGQTTLAGFGFASP
ncbi:MAG: molybdate ABC transporter substrate-binding protein [Candidatus Dormibacter sp.]